MDSEFKGVFEELKSECDNFCIKINVLRTNQRQMQRSDIPFLSSEEYYKRALSRFFCFTLTRMIIKIQENIKMI